LSTGTVLPGSGFEHLAASLAAAGRRIVVLDETETTDDLVRDVTGVLTRLCARRYGRRLASRRAARAGAVATGRAGDEEAGRVEG
jgi:putative resolvase